MDVNHIIVLAGLVIVVLLYWTAGRGKKKNKPRTTPEIRERMLEEIARDNARLKRANVSENMRGKALAWNAGAGEVIRAEDLRIVYTPDALIDAGHEVMRRSSKSASPPKKIMED